MKKILMALLIVGCLSTWSFAQDAKVDAPKDANTQVTEKTDKKEVKVKKVKKGKKITKKTKKTETTETIEKK